MTEIIDLGKKRADEFEKLSKRKAELERLVHVCIVSINSIVDINDLKRMEFSRTIESYLKDWKRELDSVNLKLNKK